MLTTDTKTMSTTGPTIRRGQSSGDIWTPDVFIDAVTINFAMLAVDLAAEAHSCKCPEYIGPEVDSLKQDWVRILDGRAGWLNPPFGNITPWAKKCAATYIEAESRTEIFLLVPASIGANWFWDWMWDFATVYSVGRMVFDNCFDKHGNLVTTPYPKDLILAHYTNTTPHRTLQRWQWEATK